MLSEVYVYLNDKIQKRSIMRLQNKDDFVIYYNWIHENNPKIELEVSDLKIGLIIDATTCLKYFGFTLDSFIDALFDLLPAKSATTESNRELIRILLNNPEMPKRKCCHLAGKNPTHYTRLVQIIEDNCYRASKITGGRNPTDIIKSIRADF